VVNSKTLVGKSRYGPSRNFSDQKRAHIPPTDMKLRQIGIIGDYYTEQGRGGVGAVELGKT